MTEFYLDPSWLGEVDHEESDALWNRLKELAGEVGVEVPHDVFKQGAVIFRTGPLAGSYHIEGEAAIFTKQIVDAIHERDGQ